MFEIYNPVSDLMFIEKQTPTTFNIPIEMKYFIPIEFIYYKTTNSIIL
ncbi:MAG: hypothetical protein ACK4R9_06140 [Ignavibacterium sp.]